MIAASFRLKASRYGRGWEAIREDELAAEALGVNIVWYKLVAFGVSFVKWRGVSLDMHFHGLGNFRTMVGDPHFWKALFNTVFFTATTGLIVPAMALYFAVAVTRKLVAGARNPARALHQQTQPRAER